MDRSSSGRPSIDIGIPPRPIALTATRPMVLVCINIPRFRWAGQLAACRDHVRGARGAGHVDCYLPFWNNCGRVRGMPPG